MPTQNDLNGPHHSMLCAAHTGDKCTCGTDEMLGGLRETLEPLATNFQDQVVKTYNEQRRKIIEGT